MLQFLKLAGTAITDRTLAGAVCKLQKLQELDLSNTAVTTMAALVAAGMPRLRSLKLECCRFLSERGLAGVGTAMPALTELDISCTAVRALVLSASRSSRRSPPRDDGDKAGVEAVQASSNSSILDEPWPSLTVLALRGMINPPRGLTQFCLAHAATLQLLDVTDNARHASSSSSFADVARALRQQTYIFVQGVEYERLAPPVEQEDPNEVAVRGLVTLQSSHARERILAAAGGR